MKSLMLTATLLVLSFSISAHAASLADTIAANPDLSTFNALLDKAGLKSTLGSGGTHTVFAPNNEAFAQITQSQLSQIQNDPVELLRVLRYHIGAGLYTSAQIKSYAASVTRPNFQSIDATPYVTYTASDQTYGSINIHSIITTPDIGADGSNIQILSRVLNPVGQTIFGPEAALPPPRP